MFDNIDKSGRFRKKMFKLKRETDKNDSQISILERDEKEILNSLQSTRQQYSNCKKVVKKLQRKNPSRRPSQVPSVLSVYLNEKQRKRYRVSKTNSTVSLSREIMDVNSPYKFS
mmetsp:Transcript_30222/g.26781  ORF Transcript_30222/g.26781 Transcript_30222/m.26781 type:complete len:114 (-) Transcript_30222:58-399(-)